MVRDFSVSLFLSKDDLENQNTKDKIESYFEVPKDDNSSYFLFTNEKLSSVRFCKTEKARLSLRITDIQCFLLMW